MLFRVDVKTLPGMSAFGPFLCYLRECFILCGEIVFFKFVTRMIVFELNVAILISMKTLFWFVILK